MVGPVTLTRILESWISSHEAFKQKAKVVCADDKVIISYDTTIIVCEAPRGRWRATMINVNRTAEQSHFYVFILRTLSAAIQDFSYPQQDESTDIALTVENRANMRWEPRA